MSAPVLPRTCSCGALMSRNQYLAASTCPHCDTRCSVRFCENCRRLTAATKG